MRQLSLFEGIPADVVRSPPATADREERADRAPSRDDGPWLFDPPVVLRLELDEALEDGRFDDAQQRYTMLVERWHADQRLAALSFIQHLDVSRLHGRLDELLRHWLDVVPWTRPAGSPEGRRAWRGLVRRLLPVHGAAALVEACPDCLAPLVNALGDLAADAPSAALEARTLMRDALLAGRALRADDFTDRRVRDLLAEDATPAWLASLGAIRRLWPVPAVHDGQAAAQLLANESDTLDSHALDAARQFWDCLRIASSPRLDEGFRHEARRRMKQLDPALHGLAFGRR